jgi:hypothetical protein
MTTTRPVALNQLIAARKGVQNEVHTAVTTLHRDSQKMQLLSGFTKTYRKINEEDADLPGESQRLQMNLGDVLNTAVAQFSRLWDLTASIDVTNAHTSADIVVDGRTLAVSVPVSTLLFLEKQLTDLHTFVSKLPVLDPAESWHWDPNVGAYATERATTVRSKKVPRNHVMAEATDRHPAQVQLWHEDVPVGYWDTVKFSGAIPADNRDQLIARVSKLREAVKMAREQANMVEARQIRVSKNLIDYVLLDLPPAD